jgi:hypothetical protein
LDDGEDDILYNYFYSAYEKNYKMHNTTSIGGVDILYKIEKGDVFNDCTHWGELGIRNGIIKYKYLKVSGCMLQKNEIYKELLFDILSYYLILNNYFLCKGCIYVKIENTSIAYQLVGTIREVLYDQFQEKIVLFFLTNYPCHFVGFDF